MKRRETKEAKHGGSDSFGQAFEGAGDAAPERGGPIRCCGGVFCGTRAAWRGAPRACARVGCAAAREAVRRARDRSRLIVRVSPADFDVIRQNRDEILEGLEAGHVEIAADDRVELGGCLLETPSGNLDSRLEVQLANLRRTLLEARSRQINEDGTL